MEAPNLTDQIAALSPERKRLLELLLREQAEDRAGPGLAARRRETDRFPLSLSQQRLWFLDQLEPGTPFYNIPIAVRLDGDLDTAALWRSVNEIVRRHESLRTTFLPQHGAAAQVIASSLTLPIPIVDLSALAEPGREIPPLTDEAARQPFDLSRGPLLRVMLLKLGERDHVLLLTMHHIISDGWSINLFVHEMAALYGAFSSGRPSPLPELPIQYADFACWQREVMKGERLQSRIEFWKRKLGGDLPLLQLSTDRPRPAVQTYRGAGLSRSLPGEIGEDLKALALQEGATLFMVLLAAFQVLLYRYTGQEDLCVGTPVANRDRADLEGLIGFFVNTLALRTDLGGEPTFRELLRRVREETLAAYEHQDLPFEMVVEAVRPERDTSYNPLFQAMFIFQAAATGHREIPGLTMQSLKVDTGTSTFDMTLSASESAGGLDLGVEYSTDLFDPHTMEQLLERFQLLLEGIVAHPDMRISDLPLLSEGERAQVTEWGRVEPLYQERVDLVHRLFETQVDLTPDAIAAVIPALDGSSPRTLTYRELNRRANRLARHLRRLGVGPETVVGICAERSEEMLVAVLATLKSGGAYLALDPMYPPARLAYMVEDSGVRVIITQSQVQGSGFRVQGFDVRDQSDSNGERGTGNEKEDQRSEVRGQTGRNEEEGQRSEVRGQRSEHKGVTTGFRPWTPDPGPWTLDPGPTIIDLEKDWEEIAPESDQNLRSSATPENLAYVVYTSGSTGRPKGVLVRHRNLANAYLAWEAAYDLRSVRVHLQMASFAFDVFSGDLVRALCSGGTLLLCPREFLLEPGKLHSLMLDHQVECAEFVPAVLRGLAEYLEDCKENLDFMRRLICGSDIWYVKEYRDLLRFIGPHTRLINSFGVAEATIDSSFLEDHSISLAGERVVPIGRPFGGTRLHVLDRIMKPQPIGIAGELCIGGAGVARGYMGNPGLSAERFVPNLFAGEEGACLYRTGDMARFLADGNIEFLGRMDDQIKIRGFRIEVGEIESTLKEHPAVQEAVVIAVKCTDRPESGPARRLAAYLVPRPGADLSMDDLRTFAKSRLPDYMIPSAFVQLTSLPLSPNGKVDRKALPLPDWSASSGQEEYVPPCTPTEEILAGAWMEILGVDRVGSNGHFFDLGGHSLLATRLVSRVRTALQVEIPLRAIFEWPTLREFAAQCDIAKRARLGVNGPPIVPVPRNQELPLSFAQQRLWFLDQLEPDSPFYNLPDTVRLSGPLDIALLDQCVNEIVRRHETLRTAFQTVDGKPLQRVIPDLTIPLPVIDLQLLPEEARDAEASRWIDLSTQQPFDLAHPPLLRAWVLRMGALDHVIALTMHHIVGDHWSSNLFFQEMTLLYDSWSAGRASPLPALPVQYADFASWQRNWLQGETLKTHLDYWKERLAGLPPLLELPTDRPRPPVQSYSGDYRPFAFSAPLTRAIESVCREEGVTLFMLLLASFQALLHRYTGEGSVAVGSPIANRNRSETEGLIGFFVNTLVLRSSLSGDLRFRKLLGQVRETTLEAYAHQDLPFEMVVDGVQPDRNLTYSPLFQVMFVFQNTILRTRSLPDLGLTIRSVETRSGKAKFDLTLLMVEEGERLSGAMEFNTDLFDAATIERMIGHFETLVASVVRDPDQRISELPIFTESERRHAVEWNDTEKTFPGNLCVHELFEAQAERTPDAVAAVYQDVRLTYRELNLRANRLAHHLIQLGVGPEVPVGICAERSLEMIIGILSILKAGGGYVPMDPTYPPERLSYMAEDSGVRVILTQKKCGMRNAECGILDPGPWTRDPGTLDRDQSTVLRPWTLDLGPWTCVFLDTDWPMIAQEPDTNPAVDLDPSNLAYVIYTSGSTGRPKGTMVQHLGVANLTHALIHLFNVGPQSRVLQFASPGFDASVTEFFPTLAVGGTLHFASREVLSSGPGLIDLIRDDGISIVTLPPSLLSVLQAGNLPALETLVSAGEPCSWEIVSRWAPGRRLLNGYGPTETTVAASYYRAEEERSGAGTVPIGRANPNTRIHVLDGNLQPAPVGVPGEIHVGGVCLARGYLGKAGLTAEKFIPDPFQMVQGPGSKVQGHSPSRQWEEQPSSSPIGAVGGQSGKRLYRSGDLARYLPDGNLEFLGRIDRQVKIRGFRIELGEIEAALTEHPAVEHATAAAWSDATAGRRVVAYVVSDPAHAPSAADLRDFLKERLPGYMMPSAFVILDRLPLNASGKVDLSRLPAPDWILPDVGPEYAAPRTGAEAALAKIWSDVLGVERIGINDNFFTLGGDSILSIQVVARAAQEGLHFGPKDLFLNPTVSMLAAVARTGTAAPGPQARVGGPVPLTPIQRWFFEQELPEPHHWNQALLLQARERLQPLLLEEALGRLISHHDALRLRFEKTGHGWRQFHAETGERPPFLRIDLSGLPDSDQGHVVEEQSAALQGSLSLSDGPMLRVALFDLGPGRPARLLIIVHHLVTDGVSWRILLQDLLSVYRDLRQGETVRLPPKTTSFQHWAERLQLYAGNEKARTELPFWLSLKGGGVRLPMDDPEGADTESSAQVVRIGLGLEDTEALLREPPARYRTEVNDLLLAALLKTFHRWTGRRTMLVELEGHGRETIFDDVDLSRTLGWFTALYPVELTYPLAEGTGELLMAVKEQLRRIPSRIGYGLLRFLCPDKGVVERVNSMPHPQIGFNYLGQFDHSLPDGSPFEVAPESRGPDRSLKGRLVHPLEINGGISGGRLNLEWTYSGNLFRRATIEKLAGDYLAALRAMVDHCRNPEAGGVSPSDFSLAGLDRRKLDRIIAKVGKPKGRSRNGR